MGHLLRPLQTVVKMRVRPNASQAINKFSLPPAPITAPAQLGILKVKVMVAGIVPIARSRIAVTVSHPARRLNT